MLGLPGNPVSAIVCANLFLLPLMRAMLGLPPGPAGAGRAGRDLPPEGPGSITCARACSPGEGCPKSTPSTDQDSARLSLLAEADALLIRPPMTGPQGG
jgi:molybdopterin molybdotransferase